MGPQTSFNIWVLYSIWLKTLPLVGTKWIDSVTSIIEKQYLLLGDNETVFPTGFLASHHKRKKHNYEKDCITEKKPQESTTNYGKEYKEQQVLKNKTSNQLKSGHQDFITIMYF